MRQDYGSKDSVNLSSPIAVSRFKAVNRLDLVDIWIMPVQRPPRYTLLVKELGKIFETKQELEIVTTRLNYLEKWVKSINFFAPEFSK